MKWRVAYISVQDVSCFLTQTRLSYTQRSWAWLTVSLANNIIFLNGNPQEQQKGLNLKLCKWQACGMMLIPMCLKTVTSMENIKNAINITLWFGRWRHMSGEINNNTMWQTITVTSASTVRLDVRKFSFSNRVIDKWNSLTDTSVNCIMVNNFKRHISKELEPETCNGVW